MESTKKQALVKASVAVRKKKGASSSAPKGVTKGSSKRKSEGKDDLPLKKGPTLPAGDKPKKSSPPKPSHGARKGSMMAIGPVT